MIRDGISWQADVLMEHASETVVYVRGVLTISLPAVLGHSLMESTDGQGSTRSERTDRDFTIRSADLLLGGVLTKPRRGDVIRLPLGTVTEEYDVLPKGGEGDTEDAGDHGLMLTIHAKYRGTV